MARQLTPLGRVLVVLSGLAPVGYGLYRYGALDGLKGVVDKIAPKAKERASVVPQKADLPEAQQGDASTQVAALPMPGAGVGCSSKPEVRALIWAWNSQMGLMFANGGAQSTDGSLMCKNNVNLRLIRQDDVSKMQEDLITFANEVKKGNRQPTKGAHFVSIMGDGTATFLKGVNDTLERLGP